MSTGSTRPTDRAVIMAVLVAALGYFVDIYDLILFGVVRKPSLVELGVPAEKMADEGIFLLNMQMIGMLLGGVLWGVIADKKGRLSVLFASIITYSVANVLNGMVTDLTQYAIVRFVAGVGLAGELGAGITLVSEVMRREARGWGTTIVASVGICGGVVASLVGGAVYWRTAYYIGGGLGFALLILRIGVVESGMFKGMAGRDDVRRGDFFHLFRDGRRALRYLAVIAVGVPIWYAVGILITLSPEIGRELGLDPAPSAPRAFLWTYAGLAIGDLASGALSQLLRSRRKALGTFLALTAASLVLYFTLGASSLDAFYGSCFVLGIAIGYWAVFVTSASEQFGTNLRATAATTAPNFVRGAVVPVTLAYKWLVPSLGILTAAAVVGAATLVLAFVALLALHETYGKDLDYVEE
jgi:MFS family permease